MEKERTQSLDRYLNDPLYRQCYGTMVSVLNLIGPHNGIVYTQLDYVDIFSHAEQCVNRVLNADYPEIEISNVLTQLRQEYDFDNMQRKDSQQIGCMIELIFIVVLWDSMEEKSEYVLMAFRNFRTFVENHATPYLYTSDAIPLWKLVTKRINYDVAAVTSAYADEQPSQEITQLKAENDRLRKELEELRGLNNAKPLCLNPRQKVQLELLCRLLETAGADFSKHGVKAEAARLAQYITGSDIQTGRNYMSNRDLNTSIHREEVLKVNSQLKKLGISIIL